MIRLMRRWGWMVGLVVGVCSGEIALLLALVPSLRLGDTMAGLLIYLGINLFIITIVFLSYHRTIAGRETVLRTDKVRVEALKERLEQQTDLFNRAMNAAPDLISMNNRAGEILFINEAALAFTNLRPDQVIGKRWRDLNLNAAIMQREESLLEQTFQTGQRTHYQALQLSTPSGTRDFEVTFTPIRDNTEQVSAVLAVAQDITERNRTAASLIASEERYRIITELISNYAYSYLVKPDGNIVGEWITNAAFRRLTGYTTAEVDAKGTYALYHADDQAMVERDVQAVVAGETQTNDYRIVTKTGELRWLRIFRSPVYDEVAGRVTRYFGVAQDITERKQAESALIASEERYRIITELISNYAYSYLVKPDGNTVREWLTEAAFTRVTGYTPAEVDAKGTGLLYHPDDLEVVERDMNKVIAGESLTNDYRIVTKTGELRWLRIFRRPVYDEIQGRVIRYFGVAQDITGKKRVDEQRLRLAIERERLTVIHRFVGAFSHYFRNQLSNIESSRYLIERTSANAGIADLPRRLNVIHECIINMRDQLDNLNVISSMALTTPVACKINVVVTFVMNEFTEITAEKKLSLNLHAGEGLPLVWASANDLQLALRHLIANAINYTPSGGVIDIRTYLHQKNPCVEVRDTGVGIAADQRDSIFDLFYKGDPAMNIQQGGVGLGLSIVRMVAETYGGRVTMQSEVGQGSTFTLELLDAEGL
ncbi:MAG: PAS domain S-box protein [Chloroflexota bacterium]|nr:PAS domain S-box protein [Chloroflexota bacterium]